MPRMMSTGSIGASRKSASRTNLPPMQTGKVFLPRSRICFPSAWYTVPSYFCSGTGYCSAISLDMRFTPLPVSTTALLSAPPISAFTSIDGPLLSPTDVAFEDPGRFRTKTGDTWHFLMARIALNVLFCPFAPFWSLRFHCLETILHDLHHFLCILRDCTGDD